MISYKITRCTYGSWSSYSGNLSPKWDHIQDERWHNHSPNIKWSNTKRCHVPVLSLIGYIDFLVLWHFSIVLTLLSPPHSLAADFIQPLSTSTEQGSVYDVSACFSGRTGVREKGKKHEKSNHFGCKARFRVTPLSAGPWSPGLPGEWWHWSSPSPPFVAQEERPPLSPGPSLPRMGGSGSS